MLLVESATFDHIHITEEVLYRLSALTLISWLMLEWVKVILIDTRNLCWHDWLFQAVKLTSFVKDLIHEVEGLIDCLVRLIKFLYFLLKAILIFLNNFFRSSKVVQFQHVLDLVHVFFNFLLLMLWFPFLFAFQHLVQGLIFFVFRIFFNRVPHIKMELVCEFLFLPIVSRFLVSDRGNGRFWSSESELLLFAVSIGLTSCSGLATDFIFPEFHQKVSFFSSVVYVNTNFLEISIT